MILDVLCRDALQRLHLFNIENRLKLNICVFEWESVRSVLTRSSCLSSVRGCAACSLWPPPRLSAASSAVIRLNVCWRAGVSRGCRAGAPGARSWSIRGWRGSCSRGFGAAQGCGGTRSEVWAPAAAASPNSLYFYLRTWRSQPETTVWVWGRGSVPGWRYRSRPALWTCAPTLRLWGRPEARSEEGPLWRRGQRCEPAPSL